MNYSSLGELQDQVTDFDRPPAPVTGKNPRSPRFRLSKAAAVMALAVVLAISGARAEQLLLMSFKGTLAKTDAAGNLVLQPVNSDTLISQCLQSVGVADTNSFALVFHQDSSDLGDTIEVVNKTNGVLACGVLRLYFQEHLERADGTLSKRFAYAYNYININSFGTAIFNERTVMDKVSHTNQFVIDGSLQWYYTNAMQVWSGTFTTGKPLVVGNAP
jgi:hypothetical protein